MLNSNRFSYLKNILETKIFLLFCVFFFIAFQSLSYFNLWVETEIYPVHSSHYLFTKDMFKFLFSLKPLFYLILYISSFFSNLFSALPMTGARFLFALNGLLTLFLMYFYIQKKTNKYNAIIAVLILASANIFLDRGFRVRSDLLSTSFSLIALLITLNIKEQKDYWKFYIVIPTLFSIMLISPKGIYWLLLSSCLILYELKNKISSHWFIVKIVLSTFIVFSFISFLFKDPFFLKAIKESFRFYLNSINTIWFITSQEGWIEALLTSSHIPLFIKRNPLLILLMFVKIFFIFQSTIITKQRKWNLSDLFFVFLIIVFLFHPQQKLFFLSSITPFFIISFFTDSQWKKILDQNYSLKFKSLFLVGAFLYSFSYISYFNYKIYMKKNNHLQKELIEKLNSFYGDTDPAISIFDPNCIIYKRKTNCKYILDDYHFINTFENYLKTHDFDLILASQKLDIFKLIHHKQSAFQYININNHIYYKAFIVDLKNRKFSLQATNLKKNENLLKTNSLFGKNIILSLNSSLKTKTPEKSRKYSYLFLDSKNKIIKNQFSNSTDEKLKDCYKNNTNFLILQAGCFYSKEEFKMGFIQINPTQTKKIKIAVFYLPFLKNLSENLSLRALFRYDMFD